MNTANGTTFETTKPRALRQLRRDLRQILDVKRLHQTKIVFRSSSAHCHCGQSPAIEAFYLDIKNKISESSICGICPNCGKQ